MKFGIAWATTFAAALCLSSSCALAQSSDYRYCIQGKSYAKGKELLQTRQLLVKVDGPPAPQDILDTVVTQVARQKIWNKQGADVTVALEPFAEVICGHALTATVSLKYDEKALQLLAQERGRGGPQTSEVSTQSVVTNPEKRTPPAGTPPGSRQLNLVEVYFATGRRTTGDPSAKRSFGTDRADELTFGAVQVLIPTDHKMANLESPFLDIRWSKNPNLYIALQDPYRTLPVQNWRTEVAARANALGRPGVLLFIHGYKNTFEDAALRAGQLAYDLAFAGPVVLFSWPSQGKLADYDADAQFAFNAVRQLSDVIASVAEVDGKKQQVTIVAHSMGSRVLTVAVSDFLRKHPTYESTIGPIVLAAPDVSREEFKQRWLNDYGSEPRYHPSGNHHRFNAQT